MRFTCETCDQDATGTWRIYDGRPTICCDGCNPANKPAAEIPVGLSYIRWFPLPKDVSEEFLLAFVSPEILAKAYAS
jgi:hypothetical protein